MAKRRSPISSIPQIDQGSLKRVLGVTDLFAVGYGDLGSSIYYALGITAMFALGATPISLAIAGFVFICTALSYAEMTSISHESGGSASFARHAFNDLVSFIAGWGLLLDYIVTIAISAFTMGPYLATFFPILNPASHKIIFTIGMIFLLYILNFFGIKQSTRISFILMVLTVVTQGGMILLGFLFAGADVGRVFQELAIGVTGVNWSPSWADFIKGTAMAMVAYTGIESIAQLGAETKKPSRTVPRSIVITMFVLVFMYLGLSTLSLAVMSPHDLAEKYTQNPIVGIAEKMPFGSHLLTPWIGFLAAVVLFVASNAGLIGASRLSFNMGEYYQLPRLFYVIHPRFRTPYVSLAFFALAASIVVALSKGKMSILADLYNFGAQIAFFSTHVSLLVMRVKKAKIHRPFKVPLNLRIRGYEFPVTAILGAVATFGVWLLVVFTKPEGRYVGMVWMAIGLLMYLGYRRKKKIPATGQVVLEKVSLPHFRPLTIRHILLPVRSGTQVEAVQVACELAKLHGAKLSTLHVIEVPFSMPLDTPLPHRVEMAASVLKAVEAITRDQGVDTKLQIVRARSMPEAILDFIHKGKHDLLVLGALKGHKDGDQKGVSPTTEKLMREAPCRVWVCGTEYLSKAKTSHILLP
jgi:APA family basic amino acid/polyamine antiporter